MSIRIMSLVWDSGLYEGSTLLTLLALADWANEEGICYPSVTSISRKSRQSERNTQRCIQQLVTDVSIYRKFRKDQASIYRINLRKFHAIAGAKLTPGDNLSPGDGVPMSPVTLAPKPPIEPPLKPKTLFGNAPAKSAGTSPANGKPAEERPTDPRFQPIVKACKQCWPDGVLFDMGAEDGAAINRMLARRHKWTAEELCECIVFRFLSENINPGESIKAWIGAVCDYSTGPRDKYDTPKPDVEYWRKHARKLLYGDIPEQEKLKPFLAECNWCGKKYDFEARRTVAVETDCLYCTDSCRDERVAFVKEAKELGVTMDRLRQMKRQEQIAGASP